jgi:ribonuclease R
MGMRVRKKDQFAEREAQNYESPIPSREFILELLAERGRPATQQDLLHELDLKEDDQHEALRRRLSAMVRDGQLHRNRRGAFGPVGKMELIAGEVIGHKDGFGFVIPDDGSDDLFITPRQMRGVFHGDKVLARVSGLDNRGRREGVIVEALVRNTSQLVGRLLIEAGAAFVEPSNQRITQDILIPPAEIGEAKSGQMVVVAITSQPTLQMRPIGKIVEILGDHMAPGMEIDVAIRNHDLPHIWSDAVLKEAAQYAAEVPESALADRKDLRHLPFVTIDGEDAKDFDDAVYCAQKGKGWTLSVAIADVSHYVKPGMALDEEALNRGNSVYFPAQVIPMLPETLSNGLCSLKPQVDRLTMVCEMQISAGGKITKYDFYEAVIHSHARLTYNQVYDMIEKQDEALGKRFYHLLPHLKNLFAIYHILHEARQIRGAIDFDMPETKIIFGEDRKIERIILSTRNDAHRVIEECMLCANICAARFLIENKGAGLFRVHEGPGETKLKDVRKFLGELGLKLPGRKIPTSADYAKLIESVSERPDVHLIQMTLLRSLSQAVYSAENKGHFGLAYDAYAHFTSPIRRYPDLLVHRAIRSILQGAPAVKKKKSKKTEVTNEPSLESYGVHCSMTERRADEATREVIDWLKCEFMLNKVGEDFAGVITGVMGFGIFVELKDVYVEGLVHISNLPNDYYQFDSVKQALQGEKTGRRFRVGDAIEVKVVRVDLDQRQIDFMLAEEGIETRRPQKKKTKKTKRAKKK